MLVNTRTSILRASNELEYQFPCVDRARTYIFELERAEHQNVDICQKKKDLFFSFGNFEPNYSRINSVICQKKDTVLLFYESFRFFIKKSYSTFMSFEGVFVCTLKFSRKQ